jgi:hypothetical protein
MKNSSDKAKSIAEKIFINKKCIEMNDSAIEEIKKMAEVMNFYKSHYGFFGDVQTAIDAFEKVTKSIQQQIEQLQIEAKTLGVDC